IIKDKLAVEVSKAKEGLYVLDLVRLGPITDGLDFFLGHCEAMSGEVEAKVFDQVQVKLTFLQLHIKAVKLKPAEDFLDMLLVDDHTDIQHVHEDGIHEALESGWGIGEAKGHHKPLIRTIPSLECGLPFITWGNLDKMVGMPKINFSMDLGLAW
ncbi:hypothetical protein M404DRAFT_121444, partial [Pisolithus tinctorius Marx 270]